LPVHEQLLQKPACLNAGLIIPATDTTGTRLAAVVYHAFTEYACCILESRRRIFKFEFGVTVPSFTENASFHVFWMTCSFSHFFCLRIPKIIFFISPTTKSVIDRLFRYIITEMTMEYK